MIGEIKEYLKKISSLKAINRSYLIPFKILDSFPEKVILKFMWKDEGSRIDKALLYKNKIEELIIPGIKAWYKGNEETDKQNRI